MVFSRIRMVLRISFGITTLPKSSIRLTIPVAFILFSILSFIADWQDIARLRDIQTNRRFYLTSNAIICRKVENILERFVMGIQSSAMILKSILTGVMIVLQALMLMCGKVTHKHLKDSAPAIP
jgi:VanZ family protein